MFKQIKKIFVILLAIGFVLTMTAGAVSACEDHDDDHGGHDDWDDNGGHDDHGDHDDDHGDHDNCD